MMKKPSTSKRSAKPTKNGAKKSSARPRIVDSSEDDTSDEDFSQRPSTSTQNKSQNRSMMTQGRSTQMGLDDLKTATNNMVKYFLNFSATKFPIKRSDITKNINIESKMFPEIFKDCTALMKEVYGLEVAEVGEKSSKAFIVYTASSFGVCIQQYTAQQRSEITLLFIILSYIFMKGGSIQEAHLIQFLSQLNIEVNEPDNTFGDVPKMIREKFIKQLYLKRVKVEIEGSNEFQMNLTWGARAEKEFNKKRVLEAVGEVMNKSPATFINQYHEATQGDEEAMVIN